MLPCSKHTHMNFLTRHSFLLTFVSAPLMSVVTAAATKPLSARRIALSGRFVFLFLCSHLALQMAAAAVADVKMIGRLPLCLSLSHPSCSSTSGSSKSSAFSCTLLPRCVADHAHRPAHQPARQRFHICILLQGRRVHPQMILDIIRHFFQFGTTDELLRLEVGHDTLAHISPHRGVEGVGGLGGEGGASLLFMRRLLLLLLLLVWKGGPATASTSSCFSYSSLGLEDGFGTDSPADGLTDGTVTLLALVIMAEDIPTKRGTEENERKRGFAD